jgi:5-methylcytosine-specific restriction endonuclease McrA
MDHVIAEISGGETSSSNIVLACVPCNRGKGQKSISEFRRVM